jgi:hypothetical protein
VLVNGSMSISTNAQATLGAYSDCQGYQNPHGYRPRVAAGAGVGTKSVTLHKPIPTARVGGFC